MPVWVCTGRMEDIHSQILGPHYSWKGEIKQKRNLTLSGLNSQVCNLST